MTSRLLAAGSAALMMVGCGDMVSAESKTLESVKDAVHKNDPACAPVGVPVGYTVRGAFGPEARSYTLQISTLESKACMEAVAKAQRRFSLETGLYQAARKALVETPACITLGTESPECMTAVEAKTQEAFQRLDEAR